MNVIDLNELKKRALEFERRADEERDPKRRDELRGIAFDLMTQHARFVRPQGTMQ